jgi:hypothetical protein
MPMRRTRSSPGSRSGPRPVLIRYRLIGGPVSVDQRITVFEDGAVELDERHRSRDPTWLRLDPAEMDRLRATLEKIPAERWSILPRLMLARLKSWISLFLGANEWTTSGTHFELKRGHRAIAGEPTRFAQARGWAPWSEPKNRDVMAAVTLLDALRVHAVRLYPR